MARVAEEERFRRALGRRLAHLRRARGLVQVQIRDRARLTVEYVSMVENGHRIPTVLTLRDWGKVLGVSLSEMFRALP